MTRSDDYTDFDPGDCFHTEWSADEHVGVAVATAVSAIDGVRLEQLEPIGEVLDPDALDALFAQGQPDNCWFVFEYEGYEVTITGGGDIWLRGRDPVSSVR